MTTTASDKDEAIKELARETLSACGLVPTNGRIALLMVFAEDVALIKRGDVDKTARERGE